jgi:hypothetical protein
VQLVGMYGTVNGVQWAWRCGKTTPDLSFL